MPRRTDDSPERSLMIHNRYERISKLGEGTYGKVYKARDSVTGEIVALKKCRLQLDQEGVPPSTIREVSLLKVLSRSNHVVRLKGAEQLDEDRKPVLYLIFEYVDQDLRKFMGYQKQPSKKSVHLPLQQDLVKPFTFQLLRGLAFMHSHGIMHRDLKPQNLLVDRDRKLLKIADLGLGRVFAVPVKQYTHEVVTLWYRAPEVLLGGKFYSLPVDIWSVGCIFAEMVHGPPIFPADCEFAQLLTIFQLLGTPTEATWPGVTQYRDWHSYPQWQPVDMYELLEERLDHDGVDLLMKMLTYNPDERITAREALRHPWFDDIDMAAMDALEDPRVLTDSLGWDADAED